MAGGFLDKGPVFGLCVQEVDLFVFGEHGSSLTYCCPDDQNRIINRFQSSLVGKLRKEIEELRKFIEGLQRKQHRPPAPHSKGPPKANPKKPGRKPGNAHGRHAHREPPKTFDETLEAPLPPRSLCCQAPLQEMGIQHQSQEEIQTKLIRRRFNIHVYTCTRCGQRVQGRHALQTSDALGAAGATIGPHAQALAVHLSKESGLSHGKISKLFHVVFGLSLTRGASAQIMLRGAKKCRPYYNRIQAWVRHSVRAEMDETGWRVAGWLQWLHVAVTDTAVLYRIEPGRGFDQAALLIGTDYRGFLVHDGWAPCDKFEHAIHGTCNAHLLRRCHHLLETAKCGSVRFPRAIKRLLQKGLALRKRFETHQISRHGLSVAAGRLQRALEDRVYRYFKDASNLRFAQHLWNHIDQILAHLRHPEISPPVTVPKEPFGQPS